MSQPEKTNESSERKHFGITEALLVLIFLISAVGVAITDMSPDWGYWFWLSIVPLLAATSLYRSWKASRDRSESVFWILRHQIFHWLGLLGSLEIIFLLYSTNRVNAPEAGLFSLLTVALATFLAGIHFHWHFTVLGILLGLSTLLVAWVEASIWIVIPVSVVVVALVLFFSRRSKEKSI
ncbi:MAG: hypothetical protein CL917_11045 [Deltaproteobacteria bacterium]|nr:hypothetical protein [Deltaproteobacteria bacterium]